MNKEEFRRVPTATRKYTGRPPNLPFPEIVDVMSRVYTAQGLEGRKTIISEQAGIRRGSSNFINIMRALKKMEFITFDEHNYRFTPLGVAAVLGEDVEQQRSALKQIFLNLRYMNFLWRTFAGKMLPVYEVALESLMSRFGLERNNAVKWLDYFANAAIFIGILENRNGEWYFTDFPSTDLRIRNNLEVSNIGMGLERTNDIFEVEESKHSTGIERIPMSDPAGDIFDSILRRLVGEIIYKKNLDEGKQAMFIHPANLSDAETGQMRIFLKSMLRKLDGFEE
ncbi:MAG: hypothetical protein ABI778_00010 [Ignavibacteriota bacterium]